MSFEEFEEFIGYDMINKSNETDKYFILTYKPKQNNDEKQEKIKKLNEMGYFLDVEKEFKDGIIRIFGNYFVKQNKNKCKIIYGNKKYKLKEYFNEIDKNYNYKTKEIKIKLIGINNIINFKKMFYGCLYLSSVSESNNINIHQYIYKSNNTIHDNNPYSSLLEDIKEKDNNGRNNSNNLDFDYELTEGNKELIDFYCGYTLSSLEKKSSKSKINSNYLDNLFYKMENLYLQNISFMFSGCVSLKSLPDLSKWNTSNVTNMEFMFCGCNSLISLPDISKWDISNVTSISNLFSYCDSLKFLPDISNWNTSNAKELNSLFTFCSSLISLPDISKWNTSRAIKMQCIFMNVIH